MSGSADFDFFHMQPDREFALARGGLLSLSLPESGYHAALNVAKRFPCYNIHSIAAVLFFQDPRHSGRLTQR